MKVSLTQFIEFAYGNKRRDKATVSGIISKIEAGYEPSKDRYKQFREAMISFEGGKLSRKDFQDLHVVVSDNKKSGYKVLSENYLNLKEDYALIWEEKSQIEIRLQTH